MEPDIELDNSFAYAVKSYSYNVPSRRYEKAAMRMDLCPVSIGDIVTLKTGQAPQRVLEVRRTEFDYEIRCEYLNSRKQLGFRPVSDYEINATKTETIKEDPMKGKLFQTLDGSVYGEGLVIDGDGKYVLKLNNGEYKAYASTELKRVMPFTFDAVYSGMAGKRYSFLGKAGSVEVGDILMDAKDFTILRVVAVGTESDSATKVFEGVKLKVEALV